MEEAQRTASNGQCNRENSHRCNGNSHSVSVRNICNSGRENRRLRQQQRAHAFRLQQDTTRTIELIDVIGNRRQIRTQGRMNSIKHRFILAALEQRSIRFRSKATRNRLQCTHDGVIDETGTVGLEGITEDVDEIRIAREEQQALLGVSEEILNVHGTAPGKKADGVTRLLYENMNGIQCKWTNNWKLDKARALHDELEADIVAYNEHKLNMKHKSNDIGFSRLFDGGEAEIRSVVAHNVHENVGRTQEGGTCMLLFGPLTEHLDMSEGSRDELGLGRWVVMTLRGDENTVTRIVCGYNPCGNDKPNSNTVYQQHRRYFINKEDSLVCPRVRFREDLIKKLLQWRTEGCRLIVCLDANENIYRKSLGKALTNVQGLNMKEVVGTFTNRPIGATYFRGQSPIDGIWATSDVQISGACIMPAGFGIGDHRLFVLDILTSSIVGDQSHRIVRPKARRLNTKIPGVASAYRSRLEKAIIKHRIIERLGNAHDNAIDNCDAARQINAIDNECGQYMASAEKKCRKIKSGRIPFSPEAALWIQQCQVYRSILRYHEGKIRNRGNLKRTARRCGIEHPLQIPIAEVHVRIRRCREKCDYFRAHGEKFRKKHLQKCLQDAREKSSEDAENAILSIIRREKEKAHWKRLNQAMRRQQGRSVQQVQVEQGDGTIQNHLGQEEIENAIWSNIHQKRFYLAEQAPICSPQLKGEFGYTADTCAAQAVLAGQYSPPFEVDAATQELFDSIAQIRAEIQADSVDCIISHGQWSDYWLHAKEETSSSRSGRHFGTYKAGAHSEIISHCHALQTSIALKRGILLERWAQGLSVMLEKVPGCSLITKLRSILLMEADFNCANKILYGYRMLRVVRDHHFMPDEIFSEKNRMADDGTLSKVLFYDLVRQSRRPAGLSSVDAENCYDRIAHAVASLIFQAFGVPQETVGSMLRTIQEMKFFLRTAYGDSTSASQSSISIKTQGLCQGNGAAPAGWAVVSITILHAHKKKGHGMKILCPITNLKGHIAAILYVDDTDVIHLDLGTEETVEEAHERLQESVISWGNLLIATGGALKPSKCFYHLISFDFNERGEWKYSENHTKEHLQISIPLPDDSMTTIEHLSAVTANKTLGSMTCPAGDNTGAITQMKEKAQEWLEKAQQAKLSRRNLWFLLDRQFWPKVSFGLCNNTGTFEELSECLQNIYWQIVPLGGLRSSVKREIRQLGTGFYGGGCPHPGIECSVTQLNKLLMHYGCNTAVGLKLQASMEFLILELGISTQPLQLDFDTHKFFVTDTWLKSVWEKASIFQLDIETNMEIPLPREGDQWLMVELRRLGLEKSELLRLNRVRITQQVLFVSDIFDARGTTIDKKYLTRRLPEQRWSTYTFPIEVPPDKDFILWRNTLFELAAHRRGRNRIGRFLHQGHKIWDWRYQEDEEKLYHLKGASMDVYTASGVPGFEGRRNCWSRSQWDVPINIRGNLCTVREVSLAVMSVVSHTTPPPAELVECSTFWEVLNGWGCTWMWEKLQMVGEDNWIQESIADNSCIAVADGSYIREINPELCATAFIMECTKGRGKMICSFAEQSSVANAYRGELLGLMQIHLILLAVQKTTPELQGEILIYSDCLGAIGRVSSLPPGRIPSRCKHSDILKNILVNPTFSFHRDFRHVEAHQDDTTDFHLLDRPAQLNCIVDLAAKREIWDADPLTPPRQRRFPCEPICCFIGQEKMTSDTGPSLRAWAHKRIARGVFERCKVLVSEQFDLVAWKHVNEALETVPRLFQLWACKQVMGIAATNGLRSRWTEGLSEKCPSCQQRTETSAHVLLCEEAGRVEILYKTIDLLDGWLEEAGTDPDLRSCLVGYAQSRGGESMEYICRDVPRFRQLAAAQDKIGWRRFMEGFVAQKVVDAQRLFQTISGSRQTIRSWASGLVIKLLEITHGQWLYRNIVVHNAMAGTLATARKEELQLEIEAQQALGLQDLQEEDQYLLEINLEDLEHTSGERQEYWLLAIKAARKACILVQEQEDIESEDEHSERDGFSEDGHRIT